MSALGPIKGESCSAHLLPASFIEWTSALYRAYDPARSCLQAGPHHALRREQGSFSTKIRLTWHSGASRILRLWLVRAHTIGLTRNTCVQFRVRGDRVGWIGNDETDMEDLTDDLQGMRCLFEIAPIRYGARPGYACKLTVATAWAWCEWQTTGRTTPSPCATVAWVRPIPSQRRRCVT